MSNALKLIPPPLLPSDLSGHLRKMAEDIEAGRITEMVIGYVVDGEYEFLWPSSPHNSLVLVALMQARTLEMFKR